MDPRRVLVLTGGQLDVFTAKTAVALLRYCRDEVVAVLDAEHAGQDLAELVGVGGGVPIVDSVAAALPFEPDHLAIGAVFPGGVLPATWRASILEAVQAGLHVINGLHTPLGADAQLVECAARHGACLYDLRDVSREYPVGGGRAVRTRAKRILTVGSDCNLGKMLTALELVAELNRRGHRAEFVATGQTGVMVAGRGEVLDAVKSDFVAGAVEALVTEADETGCEFIVVEGQGALLHPGFSAVTLGLMHGALPDLMILCHDPSRTIMRHSQIHVPPLDRLIALHEAILEPLHASKVIGIAINGFGQSADRLSESIRAASQATGLPATDCVACGVGPLAGAVLESST